MWASLDVDAEKLSIRLVKSVKDEEQCSKITLKIQNASEEV